MKKTIFEEMGGTYIRQGDYLIPCLTLPEEEQKDWEIVENITREAFYNLYVPGCVEHYLVHIMRKHEEMCIRDRNRRKRNS